MTTVILVGEFLDAHSGAVTAVASIFVAIFTIVLAWKTWGLHAATRGLQELAAAQSVDMKDSIAEAAKAAIAMESVASGIAETVKINKTIVENQRDFWGRQMRAYVAVDIGAYIRQSRQKRFEFRPNITNSGNTPASNVVIVSRIDIKSEEIPENFDFAVGFTGVGTRSVTTLFPRQFKFHPTIFFRKCTKTELRGLLKGELFFHVWGTATYDDIFSAQKFTNFSYVIFLPMNKRGAPIWHTTEYHNDAN